MNVGLLTVGVRLPFESIGMALGGVGSGESGIESCVWEFGL